MSSQDARRRWGLPLSKGELDNEVAEELAFHLEQRTRKLVKAGLSPQQARDEARRRFGNIPRIQSECLELSEQTQRQRLRLQALREFFADVRYALRSLSRRPAFALSAILTLALGIGATTAIYSVIDAVMVRSLPYADSHKLVSAWDGIASEAVYAGLTELDEFESVAAFSEQAKTLTGTDEPARINSADVSPNFFTTLGVSPLLGRSFVAADGEPTAAATVIISEELWRSRFAGDTDLLDTTIRLDGTPHTVVGVMPRTVNIPSGDTALWAPISLSDSASGHFWGSSYLTVFARLREGASEQQAELASRTLAERLRTTNPIWTPTESFVQGAQIESFQGAMAGDLTALLSLLFWAVIAVLLVACVNVANLFLSRATAKQHETSIRASLGAGRIRLLQHSLVEAWVVALAGTLLGLGLAYALVRWLRTQLPGLSGQFGEVGLDARVLAFALGLSIVATAIFGLVPSLRTTRAANLPSSLRGRRGYSAEGHTGAVLVVAQLALSVVLLSAAGILLAGFRDQLSTSTGIDVDQVVVARLDPAAADYQDPEKRAQLYALVIAELERRTIVESATAATTLPFSTTYRAAFDAPDRDFDPNALPFGPYRYITPGYFRTLGIPLLRGRDLGPEDALGARCTQENRCSAIIDQTLAQQTWPGEDALGRTIGAPWLGWYEVVGVAANASLAVFSESDAESMLYMPQSQRPQTALQLAVRTRSTAQEIESAIAAAVRSVDAQVPLSDVRKLSRDIWTSASKARLATILIAGFALVAVLLAAIGVYGVMAYRADQRRREMGIRLALGSTAKRLQSRELLRVAALCVAGLGLGAVASFTALRYFGASGLLQETVGRSEFSPALGLAVIAVLAGVALVAGWAPAKRASTLNPLETLRAE